MLKLRPAILGRCFVGGKNLLGRGDPWMLLMAAVVRRAQLDLAGDVRLLRVYFRRNGQTVASWARSWVNSSEFSSGFSQISGNPVTITHLGRAVDELDGQIKSLPLQADQVTVEVLNLPLGSRTPWPTLNGLTVILSDDKGVSLHQMVFNNIGPGQTGTHTVNLV